MALVEIRDVYKSFQRDTQRIDVFTGLTLDIEAGSFTALMGPSGSGKSTLLNLIAGLDKPTSGSVSVGDATVSAMSPSQLATWRARHIGFVFQSFNLLPVLTAAQNVELPLLLAKAPAKEARRRALALLGQVELDGWEGHKPAQLSAGQQQRVAIARALVNDPAIVWADEPTGNLDSETSAQIMDLLVRLNREQRQTLVLVTHDAIVSSRAHRILRMRNSQIVEETRGS